MLQIRLRQLRRAWYWYIVPAIMPRAKAFAHQYGEPAVYRGTSYMMFDYYKSLPGPIPGIIFIVAAYFFVNMSIRDYTLKYNTWADQNGYGAEYARFTA